jgi:hypothetical protein
MIREHGGDPEAFAAMLPAHQRMACFRRAGRDRD